MIQVIENVRYRVFGYIALITQVKHVPNLGPCASESGANHLVTKFYVDGRFLVFDRLQGEPFIQVNPQNDVVAYVCLIPT